MAYIHPGRLFAQRFGLPESAEDVLQYAAFLRDEAGLSDEPPIDLKRIYRRFGIPAPRRADLSGQQGLLLNPESGLIIINANDLLTRQRFTEAHELLELLFSQLPGGNTWAARGHGRFKPAAKEALCNRGAAELLMPRSSFLPRALARGVSLSSADALALEYEVSPTAALVNLARMGPGSHAVVLWRYRHKPSEEQAMGRGNQPSLLARSPRPTPPRRLRVDWSLGKDNGPHIPRHKSVPENCSIYRAWESGSENSAEENLDLGQLSGRFRCENRPSEEDLPERVVLSLLHLPGDRGCAVEVDEVIEF